MSSPFLTLPGAVAADPPDAGVPAHYGDPFREQRTLVEAAAVVDRSHRGVLRVTGADRLSWLHSLTSQHLERLPAGHGAEGLVLSPHGHVEHHFWAFDDGDATWLDVEPGTVTDLLGYLERMRFMLRVEPVDVTADYGLVTIAGPDAGQALGGDMPAEPYAVVARDGGVVRRRPWPGSAAFDLVVPRPALARLVAELPAGPAGTWAFEALRVAGRHPRLGFETDHKTIPHEVGWLETAVHLDKGCYRGQETVARVHNLGRPPRRLVLLHLDGSDDVLPGHGDPVLLGERQVGFVTTAARHFELGPLALALVKRNTPDDAVLSAGGVPAAIERAEETVPA